MMGKQVDVCIASVNNEIIDFYRIVSDKEVEAVYQITHDEHRKIVDILTSKGYEAHLTKFLGLPSICSTFYDVNEETINEITKKYGKLIPKSGD